MTLSYPSLAFQRVSCISLLFLSFSTLSQDTQLVIKLCIQELNSQNGGRGGGGGEVVTPMLPHPTPDAALVRNLEKR